MDSEEREILEHVSVDPGDFARRLTYADWLEERGDDRCEYLRAAVALETELDPKAKAAVRSRYLELRPHQSTEWLALVSPSIVLHCGIGGESSEFPGKDFAHARCPGWFIPWTAFDRTESPLRRTCPRCRATAVWMREVLEPWPTDEETRVALDFAHLQLLLAMSLSTSAATFNAWRELLLSTARRAFFRGETTTRSIDPED